MDDRIVVERPDWEDIIKDTQRSHSGYICRCGSHVDLENLKSHYKLGHFDFLPVILKKRNHNEETLENYGNATSSKKPKFNLFPFLAFLDGVQRFELGQKKHGVNAYNAINSEAIKNKEWVITRAEHIIYHAFLFLIKYQDKMTPEMAERLGTDMEDNDAAAILWGGAVLCEAMRYKKEQDAKN